MSEDRSNFLRRWSQRKRDARLPDTTGSAAAPADSAAAVPAADDMAADDVAADEVAADDKAAEELDLSLLPKLDEITGTSDITGFLRRGVPESLRNAALSKSWALDPAIRNYVNPALEYAYDWNTPGGVPGSGDLAAGTDIANMVMKIMGSGASTIEADAPQAETGSDHSETSGELADADAAHDLDRPVPATVRLDDAIADSSAEAAEPGVAETEQSPASGDAIAPAPQQSLRRHGAAKPRV